MGIPEKPQTKSYKDIVGWQGADDQAYLGIVDKIAPYTMTLEEGLEATYSLFQSVRYITQNKIAGDIVECGVWRGGSMMLIAHALRHFGDTDRALYLYDTFNGMTQPDEVDVDFDGNSMKSAWLKAADNDSTIGYGGSEHTVRTNLRTTGYPEQNMHFVAGDVLETIPAARPAQIALLRLDTDWYKSTLHELVHLYDRLSPQGILIIDDYGWCQGARQAVDEFFESRAFKPMMHRVNQGARVIVKPAE